MTPEKLTRLNRIFMDRLGHRIQCGPETGGSAFQYKRTKSLLIPYLRGGSYVLDEQLPGEEDRWAIANWLPPGFQADGPSLTPEQWQEKYQGQLGWPENGYWWCITPLKEGYEPDENWTHWIVDHLDWQKCLTVKQHRELIEAKMDERKESNDKAMRDMVADCFVNHVPGKRGGSYLSFNEAANEPLIVIPKGNFA